MNTPLRLLFVCTANICRSLYAEGRASQLIPADSPLHVASAGTHGFNLHPLDADMGACLARHGDYKALLSRKLTGEIVNESDLILTAESSHRTFILDEWPAVYRRVFTFSQFAESIANLPPELTGIELVSEAYRRRRPVNNAGNIPDPYRRGPEASAATAEMIDRLLDRILPRLIQQPQLSDPGNE